MQPAFHEQFGELIIIGLYLMLLLGLGLSASRLFKGTRMPGQYGNQQTTVRNQRVVQVDAENNLLLIRGAIPGPNGGYVVIKETNKL